MQKSGANNRGRLFFVYIVVLFLIVVCLARLIQLMLFSSDYQNKVEQQWTREITNDPQRGKIKDKYGEILATSVKSQSVLLYPQRITNPGEVADALAPILRMDRQKVFESASDKTKVEIWLKRNISDAQAERIKELNLKGVGFFDDIKRTYPYRDFAAHLIGYANADGVGQFGIEKAMDSHLHGTEGIVIAQVDANGRILDGTEETFLEPQNGYDIVLTMDSVIQNYLEDACREASVVSQAKSVSAIVMDPNTANVLAMTTYPSYDLNDPGNFNNTTGLPRNPTVTSDMEPGAIINFVSVAAAYENGISLNNEYECNGDLLVDEEVVRCWYAPNEHGKQNISKIFRNNCYTGLSQFSMDIGIDNYLLYLNKFGFGMTSGVDFANESSGTIKAKRYIRDLDLAHMSYGTGMTATPLQMLNAVCTAVNGGIYRTPRIVDYIEDAEGNHIKVKETEERFVINTQTSSLLKALFETNVTEGNSKSANIEGYDVGGNTTTITLNNDANSASPATVSVFVGFAPVDDHKFAVIFIVREPRATKALGNLITTPYGGKVLEKCLKHANIEPENDLSEYVEVPDITGFNADEAKHALSEVGLKTTLHSSGGVMAQSPVAGTKVKKGTSVDIYLSNYKEISNNIVKVPNLKGLDIYTAFERLSYYNLKISISGKSSSGKIVTQVPEEGEELYFGDTVVVTCEE